MGTPFNDQWRLERWSDADARRWERTDRQPALAPRPRVAHQTSARPPAMSVFGRLRTRH